MRRRILSAVLAALMGTGLAIAPASSQDADFTIDPTVGLPGDTVETHLDPDALAASECYLTPSQVQDPEEGVDGPLTELEAAILSAASDAELTLADNEGITAFLLATILGTLGADLERAPLVETLLSNFFILTFVDIGTMQPVGDRSNFDPTTGEGEIDVPELDPGLWAVAATCVFPAVTDQATFLAAIDAATAALIEYFELEEGELLNLAAIAGILLGDDAEAAAALGELILSASLPLLAAPRDQWTAPFTIPAALPTADPAVAAFCAALPQLPALGEELMAILADLPEDDGEMTPEEWAAAADWAAIGTQLSGLVDDIEALLLEGDTVRPEALADEWARATAPLRQLRDALQAVDYDLSTESGRMIAGQLRDQATAEGEGEGGDSAADVLTEWFLNHCLPEAPVDPPAAAPAAQPRGAQPRYTG